MRMLELFALHDRPEYERLLGFPAELPDLENMAPPHNHRPQGIAESYLARQRRGELPAVY